MQHFSHLLQLRSCYSASKDVQFHYNILLAAQAVKNTTHAKYKGNEIFASNRTWDLMKYPHERKTQKFSESNTFKHILNFKLKFTGVETQKVIKGIV